MVDSSNWMSETPEIYAKPLSQVCLPATHDSGTSDLTMVVPDQSPAYVEIVALIQKVESLLNHIREQFLWSIGRRRWMVESSTCGCPRRSEGVWRQKGERRLQEEAGMTPPR